MKILKLLIGVAVLGVLLVGLFGPIGPVPGVRIGGEPSQPPETWMATDSVDEIRLKVPGTLPRVVIIWVIDYRGELHVVGAKDSGWVTMIGESAPVEMRLGDQTYALQARRVTTDLEGILGAYIAKYETDYPDIVAGFPSYEEGKDQFRVFRLERS